MEKRDYLLAEAKRYPAMMPEDAMKHCYQAAFGAEHLLMDMERARAYFDAEYAAAPPEKGDLTEAISPCVHRAPLGAWKAAGLPADWLFTLFAQSASLPPVSDFEEWLSAADALAAEGHFPFTREAWQKYVAAYRQAGLHPVHHSEEYRAHYRPAYRLISAPAARLLPVLLLVTKHDFQKKPTCIIAIDGRAASGKTTAAALLSRVLSAGMAHMDDFFLPPALRTPERLAEKGGNVHYERFADEVLLQLRCKEEFTYKPFDCSAMDYRGERLVAASAYRIVEGSYSHHPHFGSYADIAVFSTVSPEEQLYRIQKRNGDAMAEIFRTRWIPMEEAYFTACRTEERADIRI